MADLRDQLQATLGDSYRLEQELGGGGMSRVFVADEVALDRKVVIKVLPPEMAAALSIDRFKREIQFAARLQHPHIVPLLSAGETDGLPYFTMPFVRGETLRARLLAGGELPVAQAVRILREVASALAYAHENRVVHRDIKPENVLISGGSAVVTDFGVAKALTVSSGDTQGSLTSTGVALGTPAYMSPEQAMADPHIDHRADIYALGVMGYEILTGATPFAGRSAQAALAAHVIEIPENISRIRNTIPPLLASLIMQCLEKRPADRPQSASEIIEQLDSLTTPSGGTTPTATVRASHQQPKWRIALLAASLVIVAAATAAFAIRFEKATNETSAASMQSIAVLPFTNMSGDPSNEYFSDGLAEELLNVLAQMSGLHVAARTSSFQFKGKTTDIREVGRQLGVSTVLEGSVRKSGDRMRITAQLIDSKTGYHMWSKTFDRKVDDVFAVQDEITKAISDALKVQLGPATRANLNDSRPVNATAHDLYLKGLFAQNLRSEAGVRDAVGYYKAAIRTDSTYAIAYAQLGRTLISGMISGYEGLGGLAEVKSAVQSALHFGPSLVETRTSHAMLLDVEQHFAEAEAEIRQIVSDHPNYPDARVIYGLMLARAGRPGDALEQMRIAQNFDPMSVRTASNVGMQFFLTRDFRSAVTEFQRVLTMAPDSPDGEVALAASLSHDGQHVEAIKAAQRAVALSPHDPSMILTLAYVYARGGEARKAEDIVREQEKNPRVKGYAMEMAEAYGALGRKDDAFRWLNRVENIQYLFPNNDPMFDALRDDPRFAAFLAKAKH